MNDCSHDLIDEQQYELVKESKKTFDFRNNFWTLSS